MSKAIVYSENPRAMAVFSDILREEGFEEVELNDRIAFCGVDNDATLQLVNAGPSFDLAAKLAEKLVEATGAAVLLLTEQGKNPEHCRRLREMGAIIVEKPLSRQLFVQSIRDAVSLYGRIRKMSALLNETRRIDRAKMLLVEARGMTEVQAHKFIERQAMNRRITRLDVANELINSIKQ